MSQKLSLSATAQDQELIFAKGRALSGTTNYFAPNYDFETQHLDKSQTLGLIIGFLVYGVFIIFAVVSLWVDACRTDIIITAGIEESLHTLKNKFKLNDREIDQLIAEFEDKDTKLQSGVEDNHD